MTIESRKWEYLKSKVKGIAWDTNDQGIRNLIDELINEADFLMDYYDSVGRKNE